MKMKFTITHYFKNAIFKWFALMGLALMTNNRLVAQDIYINLNNPRQGIDGVGFCHEGDRQNGNYYVINNGIQQMLDNHMTLFRDMFPNKTWQPSKGTFNYTDARVVNSFQRLKTMQNRGIKTILGIWDVPNWMVSNPSAGSNRKINNFDDFAYFITSFLLHGKNNYGLTVDYVDVNETKTSGVNISLTAQEYITLIQKCQTLFTANGIQTKINLGSVLLWDIQYCKDIYNAVRTLSVAGYPSWHSYRGGSTAGREPISYWEGWGSWQMSIDRNLWGTETDYDAFYWENPDRLTWQGVEEMAVMYYRNYYVARMSTSAGWFWHPEWPSNNVHTAYMNHFEPGGQIVETSQPNSDIMTVAYKHVANKKFVIQVLNQSSSPRTVTFHGVPANKPLTLVRTSEAGDRNKTVGTYTPNGTDFTITLQANSFNTFYSSLDVNPDTLGVASVFKDCSYGGYAVNLPVGNYTLAQLQALGIANDDISSVQVQSGYKITLFADNNFSGSSLTKTNSDVCLFDDGFNDAASSLKVETYSSSSNLAYMRPVFTTSNENDSFTGAKAVDANGNTRWSSSYANNQSIVVDLGANYNVNRVRLGWEAAYARDYQLQFSTDNVNWTTVREFWGKSSADADDQTGLSGVARYVKVYCINRATAWGFSLYELEVYGTAASQAQLMARSVTALPDQAIRIFPNPVQSQLTIQLPVSWQQNSELKIYNSEGTLVLKKQVNGHVHTLPFSSLPAGVYMLQVNNAGRQISQKIIRK